MQAALIFILLGSFSTHNAFASDVTPVQKVLQMLQDMKAKGAKQMAEEKKVYDDYSKWVRMQTLELDAEIKSDKAAIEKLIAFITKAEADIAKLTKDIAELDKEANELEANIKAATAEREAAKAKFLATQTDYTESLYALDQAIQTLQAQDYSRPQAMMLIQKMSSEVQGMRRVLASLALEESQDQPSGGAPAVAGYEFQSKGVLDMLDNLKDKFRKEIADLEKEEMNSDAAYSMEMVHMTDTLENVKAERDELAQIKSEKAAASSQAKGDLAETKASLAESEKFFADMKATYADKTATYEANQKLRAEELEALAKTIEVIANPDVSGAYTEHVKNDFLQEAKSTPLKLSFLQVHSASRRQAKRNTALDFLQRRAKELNSKTLSKLASNLSAGNPFDKVIQMIEDLLDKLKEEAASEAEHKAYCDKELHNNKLKRDKFTAEIDKLRPEIELKGVTIADMAKKIAVLAEEQAVLRKSMAEATEQRTKEKAENKETVEDMVQAQEAMKNALAIMRDFYAKAGESLLQQVPEMAEYKGMQRTKGGVIGMLEVIMSDFARVETDTRAAETQAEAEYKSFMADAEADLKAKHDAEFKLGLAKDETEFDKSQLERALAAASKRLDMANEYYDVLKPQCVEVHVSYEERAKMRQDEIEALNQAYKILDEKNPGS